MNGDQGFQDELHRPGGKMGESRMATMARPCFSLAFVVCRLRTEGWDGEVRGAVHQQNVPDLPSSIFAEEVFYDCLKCDDCFYAAALGYS